VANHITNKGHISADSLDMEKAKTNNDYLSDLHVMCVVYTYIYESSRDTKSLFSESNQYTRLLENAILANLNFANV
jgi:hypothetical protein